MVRADEAVRVDRGQVHAHRGERAVERGQDALPSVRGIPRERAPFHTGRGFDAGHLAEGRREVDVPDGGLDLRGPDAGAGRGTPNQRDAQEGVHVVGALEEEAGVAEERAVVGGVDHVGALVEAAFAQPSEHAPAGLVDELVLHVNHGADFAELVCTQTGRNEGGGSALRVVVPAAGEVDLGVRPDDAKSREGRTEE